MTKRKKFSFLAIMLIGALLISWMTSFEKAEAASVSQKRAFKMAQKCEYYVFACAVRMSKGTKHVKLTNKNKLTIAGTVDYGHSNAVRECKNLFGKKISASILPREKNYDTNMRNYANFDKLVVKLDNGDIVCNLGDMGDYFLKTKLVSFKESGGICILKVHNYIFYVYDGVEKTLKYAATTFKLKPCSKSKYGLKITGIRIKKLISGSLFF